MGENCRDGGTGPNLLSTRPGFVAVFSYTLRVPVFAAPASFFAFCAAVNPLYALYPLYAACAPLIPPLATQPIPGTNINPVDKAVNPAS